MIPWEIQNVRCTSSHPCRAEAREKGTNSAWIRDLLDDAENSRCIKFTMQKIKTKFQLLEIKVLRGLKKGG